MTITNITSQKSGYRIISVGGSIIIPKTGFDVKFLKKFRSLILDRVNKGDRFVLVIGGGATCRAYQHAAKAVRKMTTEDVDWLGIYSTWFNAEFVRLLFGSMAFNKTVNSPNKKIITKKSIIISQGHKPGCSSDKVAVMLAKTYGAKEVINLSNIDYVYNKDPNKFTDAKKIEKIIWKDFRKNIVGYKWLPGKNSPFDPIASGLAQKLGLKVSILRGTNLPEVKKALGGKKFKGTVVY